MSRRRTTLLAALVMVCGASALAAPTTAYGRPAGHAHLDRSSGGTTQRPDLLLDRLPDRFPEYDGSAQVYSVRADGSDLEQLTHASRRVRRGCAQRLARRPDDRVHEQRGRDVRADADEPVGAHQRTILTDPGIDYLMPSWSPTGHRLVVSACDLSFGFEAWCDLVTVRRDGTHEQTVVGGHRYHSGGQYSPNGRWIEFQSDRAGLVGAIWIVRATGGAPRRVTRPAMEAFLGTWTPDGRHILFADNCCQPHSNLYVVTRRGRHLRQLTHVPDPHNAVNGTYSPDGRLIAFAGDALRPVGSPKSDLFTMRADGTHVTRIVKSVGPVFQSSWSRVPAPAPMKGVAR